MKKDINERIFEALEENKKPTALTNMVSAFISLYFGTIILDEIIKK